MGRWVCFIGVGCWLWLLAFSCQGQGYYWPSLPDSVLFSETGASRVGINTFNQNSQSAGYFASPKQQLLFNHKNNVVYNQALQGSKFVTNDIIFNANYQYLLKSWLRAGFSTDYYRYGANNTTLSKNLAFLKALKTYRYFSYEAMLFGGSLTDNRNTYFNTGLGGGYKGGLLFWSKDSTALYKAEGEAAYFDIAPRNTRWLRNTASIEKQFNKNASISLQGGYYNRKVEDYLLGNIQSISSDTILSTLGVTYRISDRLGYSSQTSYGLPSRQFTYRSFEGSNPRQNIFYNQMMIDTRHQITGQVGRFQGNAQFLFSVTDRAYYLRNNLNLSPTDLEQSTKEEQRKDIREATTTWIYDLTLQLNKKDILIGRSTAQLFRVDTRSSENNQDRDEVLYAGELIYQRRWSRIFQTECKIGGTYRQLVYITPQQSSENYTERMVRFEPNFILGTKRLSWKGNYSLQATYNVRDFSTEQLKNRSNRIFLTYHIIDATLTKKWHTLFDFSRRENRLSLLNWTDFKESPLDTVVIYDCSIRFQYAKQTSKGASLKTYAGYRYFRQTRQNEAGLNKIGEGVVAIALDNIVIQQGPRFGITWQTAFGLYLYADCWLQQNDVFYAFKETSRIYLGQSFSNQQLQQKQNLFLPYFSVMARYNLSRWRSLQ